jgi:hypothetical protein
VNSLFIARPMIPRPPDVLRNDDDRSEAAAEGNEQSSTRADRAEGYPRRRSALTTRDAKRDARPAS